jgi:hypothetical protein
MTLRPGSAAILTMIVLTLLPSALKSQAVDVIVRDSVSRESVSEAIVTLVRPAGSVAASGFTGSTGRLQLKAPKPGSYALFVRKLGFEPKTSTWFDVGAGESAPREIDLRRIPQFLPDVAIRAERESIRDAKFFGLKIGSLGAVIFTPSQVDRALHGSNDYTGIVTRNPSPGIGVDYGRKCVLSTRGDPPACLPVIVDGLLMSNVNDVLPPEIIDYMLVVRGNELGVMYGTIGELGAVVIFTKRGLKRGPQTP